VRYRALAPNNGGMPAEKARFARPGCRALPPLNPAKSLKILFLMRQINFL
jgi:hypothetical protein